MPQRFPQFKPQLTQTSSLREQGLGSARFRGGLAGSRRRLQRPRGASPPRSIPDENPATWAAPMRKSSPPTGPGEPCQRLQSERSSNGHVRTNHAETLTSDPRLLHHSGDMQPAQPSIDKPRWRENAPFWSVHAAAAIGAFAVGWSWTACAWLVGTYAVRMFAITAGYHRYFSHRTYKTSRPFQFVLAPLGMSCAPQGPLWGAAHHRRHHKTSDTPDDVHSPRQRGFYYAHIGWIFENRQATDLDKIRDLANYPELRWLDRHDTLCLVGFGALSLLLGGTTGLAWGFFMAIVVSWHV